MLVLRVVILVGIACTPLSAQQCRKGYVKRRDRCVPHCKNMCLNAICVAPNRCKCIPGYTPFSPLKPHECHPHCENCSFGYCTKPNECRCYNGYDKDSTGQCKPTCKSGCPNGYCKTPNKCVCNSGFTLNTTTQICLRNCEPGFTLTDPNTCSPICKKGCPNGFCSQPGVCQCNTGYAMNEINSCEPICEGGCPNGYCSQPGVCLCNKGFIKSKDNLCEKANDFRIKPKKSKFHKDKPSQLVMTECQSSCYNGTCSEGGKCECLEGYAIVSTDKNLLCIAQCVRDNRTGCLNGYCRAPNECVCFADYQPSDSNPNECVASREDSVKGAKFNYLWLLLCLILPLGAAILGLMYYFARERTYEPGESETKIGMAELNKPHQADVIRNP